MPQLDKLTFYTQAVTMLFTIVFLFVFLTVFVLPSVYKVKKVRWILRRQVSNELPVFLQEIIQLKLSVLLNSADGVINSTTVFENEIREDLVGVINNSLETEEEAEEVNSIAQSFVCLTVAETYICSKNEIEEPYEFVNVVEAK